MWENTAGEGCTKGQSKVKPGISQTELFLKMKQRAAEHGNKQVRLHSNFTCGRERGQVNGCELTAQLFEHELGTQFGREAMVLLSPEGM